MTTRWSIYEIKNTKTGERKVFSGIQRDIPKGWKVARKIA